jgi:hypothetical protein
VSNVVIDALSRHDVEAMVEVSTLSAPAFTIFNNLHAEFIASPEAAQLLDMVTVSAHGEGWRVTDNLVTCRGRVVVPPTSSSLHEVLAVAHGLGHEGTKKTLHRLHVDFHVPSARAIVHDFIRECHVCQSNKTE